MNKQIKESVAVTPEQDFSIILNLTDSEKRELLAMWKERKAHHETDR